MALRFYIVPAVVTPLAGGPPGAEHRTAAYVAGEVTWWRGKDYGIDNVYLVLAEVTPTQHANVAANSPIAVVPEDIDQQIGAALATVQANLEQFNLPAGWLNASMTYRVALRYVAIFFQISQRLWKRHKLKAFPSGITLNTTAGALTTAQRDALADVANSFGWDHSWVTGATTMRQLIKGLADQWSGGMRIAGMEL